LLTLVNKNTGVQCLFMLTHTTFNNVNNVLLVNVEININKD